MVVSFAVREDGRRHRVIGGNIKTAALYKLNYIRLLVIQMEV